jgi:hypothetical protein
VKNFQLPRNVTSSTEMNIFHICFSVICRAPWLDHFPTLLDCGGLTRGSGSFKFENMWLKAEGFVELVIQWWDSYHFFGTPCFVPTSKLKQLKADLILWNKEVFGNVEVRKKALLEEIQTLDCLEEERELAVDERYEAVGLLGGKNLGLLGLKETTTRGSFIILLIITEDTILSLARASITMSL